MVNITKKHYENSINSLHFVLVILTEFLRNGYD